MAIGQKSIQSMDKYPDLIWTLCVQKVRKVVQCGCFNFLQWYRNMLNVA